MNFVLFCLSLFLKVSILRAPTVEFRHEEFGHLKILMRTDTTKTPM